MTKIEAVIRPEKLDALQHALEELGHGGHTVAPAHGSGKEAEVVGRYRGMEYRMVFAPKVLVTIVVPDPLVTEVVWAIRNQCLTGQPGDGKIFLIPVIDAIRIRTGQRGPAAL